MGDATLTVTLPMLLTVCPLVFFASCVDAIAGGGGLISLPAYRMALPADMDVPYDLGSNKFSACFGTLMAVVRFFRSGKLLLWPSLFAALGAGVASFFGAQLAQVTPASFRQLFMLIMVPIVAILFFLKKDAPEKSAPITRGKLLGCLVIGLGCGFYDGFFGPGTGMFLIMLFTWGIGMDMVTASGTAKVANLASNLTALASFILGGHVLYQLAVPAMLCSIVGGYVGAHLALKNGAKLIRIVMLAVLAALILKLAWDYFGA